MNKMQKSFRHYQFLQAISSMSRLFFQGSRYGADIPSILRPFGHQIVNVFERDPLNLVIFFHEIVNVFERDPLNLVIFSQVQHVHNTHAYLKIRDLGVRTFKHFEHTPMSRTHTGSCNTRKPARVIGIFTINILDLTTDIIDATLKRNTLYVRRLRDNQPQSTATIFRVSINAKSGVADGLQ